MDHVGILKQAFQTTIRNPALWILGFIWALVGGGGSGGSSSSSNAGSVFNYQMDSGDFNNMPDTFANLAGVFSIIAVLCCLLFFFILIVIVINYILRAGIVRTIHTLDVDGTKPSVRRGFREGWHRRTWRLWFQDLIIWFPFAVIVILSLLLVAMPLLLLSLENDFATAVAIIGTVGLFIGWLAIVIVAATILGVLSEFWWRAAAIGDQTTGTAIRSAWRLVRNNLGDVAIMWLLMLGIGILWAIIMFPFVLVVLALAGVAAIAPAAIIYQASESLLGAMLWGIPVGFVLMVIPVTFVSGLFLIFRTAVWNQVYDQLAERTGLAQST